MNRRLPDGQLLYLKPGELVTTDEPLQVSTVLGSCIAVTMFAPRTSTAAICHAMLPQGDGSGSFKFVDVALSHMLEYFQARLVQKRDIQVKLFGGADMFGRVAEDERMPTVGRQNLQAAARHLAAQGLTLAASDVGGQHGRKLIFHSDTGVVLLKRLDGRGREPSR